MLKKFFLDPGNWPIHFAPLSLSTSLWEALALTSLYKMFSFQNATESPNEHLPMVHEYKNTLIEIFIF